MTSASIANEAEVLKEIFELEAKFGGDPGRFLAIAALINIKYKHEFCQALKEIKEPGGMEEVANIFNNNPASDGTSLIKNLASKNDSGTIFDVITRLNNDGGNGNELFALYENQNKIELPTIFEAFKLLLQVKQKEIRNRLFSILNNNPPSLGKTKILNEINLPSIQHENKHEIKHENKHENKHESKHENKHEIMKEPQQDIQFNDILPIIERLVSHFNGSE